MTDLYPWQQSQWRQCVRAHQQQRLAHALLLTGPSGLGKIEFAQQLAQFCLCDQPGDQACGQCRSCQLFLAGNHPDCLCCQREEGSKAIKVDQIRQLIAKLATTAQRGQGQVVIIEPADSMNVAAANALLKTLEEPSGQVQLLLVAHRTNTIPATILSRCQQLHFAVEDEASAKSWLQAQANNVAQIDLAWRLSDRAPLRALQLLQSDVTQQRDDVLNHLGCVLQKGHDPIAVVDQWVKIGVAETLIMLLSIVNDIAASQLAVSSDYRLHGDQAVKVDFLATRIASARLMQFQRVVLDKIELWQRSNSINPQLLLESVLCQWYEVKHVC